MWLLRGIGLLVLGVQLGARPGPMADWYGWGTLALGALGASLLEWRRPGQTTLMLALGVDYALMAALFRAWGGVIWAYWLFFVPLLYGLWRAGAAGAYLSAVMGAAAIGGGWFWLTGEVLPREPLPVSMALGFATLCLVLGWVWQQHAQRAQHALLEQATEAVEQSEAAQRTLRQHYRELVHHYHRLEEHLCALQDAAELLHALHQARSPDEIYRALLERLRARFGASGAALYLTDESGALLRTACAIGSLSDLMKTAVTTPLRPFQKPPSPQQVADQLRAVVLEGEHLQAAHGTPAERADALVLPLQNNKRIVGVLALSTRAEPGFSPEQRTRLEALAPYLGSLLELSEQMHLMSVRLAETQLLYDLENLLFSVETAQSLPQRALTMLKSVLPFEHAQLLLKRDQRWEVAAQIGALPDLRERFSGAETEWLARAQLIDARHPLQPAFAPAQSLLIAPLRGGIRIEGALVIGRTEPPPFTEPDLELLQTLAFQLTSVLERAQLLSDLERMATTDGLTGLYNYRHFQERYREAVRLSRRYQHPLAIMLIDLDGFKQVNDQYGHLEGDYLLVQVAEVLQNALRNTEFIARYGGDEFVVMMHATNLQGGIAAAKRVMQAVRDTPFMNTQGQPCLKISVSIGVAAYPNSTDNPAEVLEKADEALEIAKRSGRNQVVALENTA